METSYYNVVISQLQAVPVRGGERHRDALQRRQQPALEVTSVSIWTVYEAERELRRRGRGVILKES